MHDKGCDECVGVIDGYLMCVMLDLEMFGVCGSLYGFEILISIAF